METESRNLSNIKRSLCGACLERSRKGLDDKKAINP